VSPEANRLGEATSPYLRQHADNPVHWQQWTPEALAEATRRNVPILLSIGYAACHWCHVMAHESFEDDEVAAVANANFVAIKVDREERPDLDAVYMNATVAMTGHGGWPMTCFLTPDGRPFFCGTYFPKAQFIQLMLSVAEAWTARRGEGMLADPRRELGALHGLLLAPLLPMIGDAGRVVVAPHGPLHGLPFAALWDGEAHLVERREVVSVPSASVLGRLAPERAGGAPLVVGVPDDAAPSIGEEAAAVAAMLPGARLLAGDAATVPAVAAAARDAALVHLACHGRFDPATPQASGLALADRWLTARDVSAMRLRARLVTLSGCETGRAVVSAGDELAGLVRATLAAGASSLIYSLWLAHDRTTTELMLGVYRSLVAGHGPAAALRSAQRDALSLTPHPAFWAHFVLGGHP